MSESDNKPKKRATEHTETDTKLNQPPVPVTMPTEAAGALSVEEAATLMQKSQEVALESYRAMQADAQAVLMREGPATPAPADVTDELMGGAPAFGSFVKSVGLAVAEAQTALDATLVQTAKALSETKINTVAVFEQQINDDTGLMDKGIAHLQELPLVNYLMPTAYQWSRVYLEADMKVSEFNASQGFKIQRNASSFNTGASASVGGGPFGFSGKASAYVNYGSSSSTLQGESSYGQDTAAGSMHMEATLEPRSDIRLPQPFIVQKGPRLKVSVGPRTDIMEGPDDKKVLVGRRIVITATLMNSHGDFNAGKDLEIKIDNASLNYTLGTTGNKTDDKGVIQITVERKASADELKTPVQALVRVWFGLVNEVVGIAL